MATIDTLKKRLDALQPPRKQVVLFHVNHDDVEYDDDDDDQSWVEEEELFEKRYIEAVERVGLENITVVHLILADTQEKES
jgi:hypothetical protein